MVTLNEVNKDIQKKAEWYFNAASSEKDDFLSALKLVAIETNCLYLPETEKTCIKSLDSIIHKLLLKGVDRIVTDALRFTLIINNPSDLDKILSSLSKQGYKVWTNPYTKKKDITDRFLISTPGYKDIAIKLVSTDADNIVKELQLIQPAMYRAKQAKGHDIYDAIKALDRQRDEVFRTIIDSAERANILLEIDQDQKALESMSNALYQQAFEEDSETGRPNFS